jgi:hypothetical protein
MMLMGFFIKIPALTADIPLFMRPAKIQLEKFSPKQHRLNRGPVLPASRDRSLGTASNSVSILEGGKERITDTEI